MNYQILGEKIKKERLNRGLTQEDLAEKANLSVSFMGQIERGERKLSVETLEKIGNTLGTSFDYLLQSNHRVKPEAEEAAWTYLKKNEFRVLSPDQVADAVFAAIREEKFYILTHPEFNEMVKRRLEDILQGQNPPLAPLSFKKGQTQ